jgi:hypothetical protein
MAMEGSLQEIVERLLASQEKADAEQKPVNRGRRPVRKR